MGKIVSVWGTPYSGTTTFAIKLANTIYDNYKSTITVLLCDFQTPLLSVLFPFEKSCKQCSLGQLLSLPKIDSNNVIKHMVTTKGKGNLAFLGYCAGDTINTYPKYDAKKASDLLKELSELSDFVIVDTVNNLDTSVLSGVGIKASSVVFNLFTPDLRSIIFNYYAIFELSINRRIEH